MTLVAKDWERPRLTIPQLSVRAALSLAHPRSREWPSVRAEHLLRQPRCMACGTDKELQVHHIVPFHLHPHLELEDENLITLCELTGRWCHFRVGHCFDWRLWNCWVEQDAKAMLAMLLHRRGHS